MEARSKNWLDQMLSLYYLAPFHALFRALEADALSEFSFSHPILDLGCGDGTFSSSVFDKIEVGLDVSPGEVVRAKGQTYQYRMVADARRLPFRDDVFQSVVSVSVLEHITGVLNLLDEVSRVLSEGGIFVFTVPNEKFSECLLISALLDRLGMSSAASYYKAYKNRVMGHIHCYSGDEWRRLLEKSGLLMQGVRGVCSVSSLRAWDVLSEIFLFLQKWRRGLDSRLALGVLDQPSSMFRATSKTLVVRIWKSILNKYYRIDEKGSRFGVSVITATKTKHHKRLKKESEILPGIPGIN